MTASIRILLVDDHPMVREGLVARLAAVPRFEVVGEAGNRVEALDQLARTAPDVVLMDVGLHSARHVERVRAHHADSHVPSIRARRSADQSLIHSGCSMCQSAG